MIIDDQYYDVIIIGTGAGGGTLARKLAPTGKKILILERGELIYRESSELVDTEVFKKEQYHAKDAWFDNEGEPFYPQTYYSVGGNTKIWSGVLQRMRERDFEQVQHQGGVSPAWPLKYQDFEPYYTEAEKLYQAHGKVENDPTEPPHSEAYPFAEIAHEPMLQSIGDTLSQQGLHPVHLPLGVGDRGRTDAEDTGVSPVLTSDNVTLKTSAQVVSLHTNPSGAEIKAVEAKIGGQSYLFLGDIIVLACGAVNSAALLLRSANEKHPNGIANGSGQVGRNFMKQLLSVVVQLTASANSGTFSRTLGLNDFYWGDKDFPYPLGHVQNSGGILQDVIFAEAPPILSALSRLMPNFGLRQLATHSIGWWLQTEDLPNANNRVHYVGDKLRIDYTPNNVEAHDRLVYRWIDVLKNVEATQPSAFNRTTHPRSDMPIQVLAHQCGTCRFGEDPATSVLNLDCRTHEVHNLYVVDSSFFPSHASVSPGLTVIANALRVGDRLIQQLSS
ncbi:GMC family oxidoreductase [Oscillatoria sp. FACHB-1407]|uniref:GMC oxidoreductase n=1 Tax=Oscillatoria sp. FACHB-1407 TaxID=2692847 RepID=UPI001683E25D|nr:GMC family oxidoreductase [Oscillatoria sp. FACHB-1407]MBD2465654.1 GMC family oxidoreductase [Oscillatoria sp. FACHB-1407]